MRAKLLRTRIRNLRHRRGWSQQDLATRMQLRGHEGITQPRIAEIETGVRDVSASELVSLARIFGVAISELLGVPDKAEE